MKKPSSWPPQPHRSLDSSTTPGDDDDKHLGWSVTITTTAVIAPDESQLDHLLENLRRFGAAFSVGGGRIEVTMSAAGANALDALERATAVWRRALLEADVVAGIDVAAEVMTADEQQRRLAL